VALDKLEPIRPLFPAGNESRFPASREFAIMTQRFLYSARLQSAGESGILSNPVQGHTFRYSPISATWSSGVGMNSDVVGHYQSKQKGTRHA